VQAKIYLPDYGFNTDEINAICGMIMATKIPQTPYNRLEEIIADADLEYLGTNEAETQANLLFQELRNLNPGLHEEHWNQTQLLFLEQHHFFTSYCKTQKEPAKLEYLNSLKRKF
jgi:uncharacterized protein